MSHIQRIHDAWQPRRKLLVRRDRQVVVRKRPVRLWLHRRQRRRMFQREVPNPREMEIVRTMRS